MKIKKIFTLMLALSLSLGCFTGCELIGGIVGDNENSSANETSTQGEYTVITRCSEGGALRVDKESFNKGDSIQLEIIPESGYGLMELFINGQEKSKEVSNNLFPIDNVAEYMHGTDQLRITAKFEVGIVHVADEHLPNIDGEIDAIWETAPALLVTNKHYSFGYDFETTPYAKVMWNEKGMYFLGYVYDATVVSEDRCNFWFSETYVSKEKDYSANPIDGNYAICINSEGENLQYTEMDVSQYWKASASKFAGGYVVEIYMPVLSETPLSQGNKVGLDISVDYYSQTAERDYYANWYGTGKYWENVGALKAVNLL